MSSRRNHKRPAKKRARPTGKRSIPRSVTAPTRLRGRFARIQPREKFVELVLQSFQTISGAVPKLSVRFNPNSAYQPLTSGATASTPGYADWAALYGYYRVLGYKYQVTFCNLQTTMVAVWVVNTNADPTTTFTIDVASNRMCQVRDLAAKGGMDRTTVSSRRIPITSIVGSSSPLTDDLYSAVITANPSDVTWMAIGAQSIDGSNLSTGVQAHVRLHQYIQFYDPLPQI